MKGHILDPQGHGGSPEDSIVRINGRFLSWGVFFILLGAIPLAVQANLVDRELVARSWQLWPFLIIGGGVGLLLRQTSFEFAGGFIVAATFGLIVGGVVAVGADLAGLGRGCGRDPGQAFATRDGTIGGGAIGLKFDCGELTVATTAGAGWTLAGTSHDGEAPTVTQSDARLDVRSRDGSTGMLGFGTRQSWSMTLPQAPAVNLTIEVNAGTGTIALDGAHLGDVAISANASSLTIDLGAVAALERVELHTNVGSARVNLPNTTFVGSLDTNAGSIAFCVPDGVGIRITTSDNITSSNNFAAQGLTKVGDAWQTPDYANAGERIGLTASANAGSLQLNPDGGCE